MIDRTVTAGEGDERICPLCKKDCRDPRVDHYGQMPFPLHWFGEKPFANICNDTQHGPIPEPEERCCLEEDCLKQHAWMPASEGIWCFHYDSGPGEYARPFHIECWRKMLGIGGAP